MLRGAKLRGCDWGLDYEDGIGLLLPHLNKARELARLAALHARHELEQGHVEAAAEDASAILALARHVGSEPIVISILVRYSIEANAVDLLASYLPEMQALAPGIVSTYEALPPAATLQRAYLTMEKELTLRWLVKKMRDGGSERKGRLEGSVEKRCGSAGEAWTPPTAIDSFEQAVKLTEDLLPVCDELATLVALPAEEFDARYPEFKKKTEAAHPLVDVFLTTPDESPWRPAPEPGEDGAAQGGNRRGPWRPGKARGHQGSLRNRAVCLSPPGQGVRAEIEAALPRPARLADGGTRDEVTDRIDP